jgi:hypothetical protein
VFCCYRCANFAGGVLPNRAALAADWVANDFSGTWAVMISCMSAEHTVNRPTAKRRNIVTMMVSFGRELTLLQRIGYSLFGLVTFALGLQFLDVALGEFRGGDLLGAIVWTMPGAILTAIGTATFVNVLRFPHSNPSGGR